jgi:hypothetical protein
MNEKNSLYTFKWANQLHWQVKGHLIPRDWATDEEQVRRVFESYFARLWNNEEAYIHLDGFEKAWEKRYGKSEN